MTQPIPITTRSQLTQSSASAPTWSYWESLGYSEEQPLKTEYFVKRMWPKGKLPPSASAKPKTPLIQPLSIRRVRGEDTQDFTVDEVLESTQEYSSQDDYEEDPEVELDESRIF